MKQQPLPKPRRQHHNRKRKGHPPPLVTITLAGLRGIIEQYKVYRIDLPLKERFRDLLWSPEGFLPEVPTPKIDIPDEKNNQLVEHRVNDRFWWNKKMQRQKKHGDGHWTDRGELQKQALKDCEDKIYKKHQETMDRARENTGYDWEDKLNLLKEKADRTFRQLEEQICEIGEWFRDEWWLALQEGALMDWARNDFRDEIDKQTGWERMLKWRERFATKHLGPTVEPKLQEYIHHLRQLEALEPVVGPYLDFRHLVPNDARYARPGKGGNPYKTRRPVSQAKEALLALRPKIQRLTIDKFLIAWGLKYFPLDK